MTEEKQYFKVEGKIFCFDCMKLEMEHLAEGTFFDILPDENYQCERCKRWEDKNEDG